MAVVKAEYLVAKDSESGEEQNVKFVPPAPSDGDLGGISKEDSEQITENKNDITDIRKTLWDKILDKLTNAVVTRLNTTDKTVIGALNELNSKQSKTISVSNVTDIQTLVNSATGGTNILFHLAGAGYTGSDLPNDAKYKYGSGIIFFRNSNSCKIVLFPEEVKPVWKMSNWTKWKDFANNIVD